MRQIVKRDIQHITSPYGRRGMRLHKGIDLRSWDDNFSRKLNVVLPERCVFMRVAWQEKWGFTQVFKGVESGKVLKFVHVDDKGFEKGVVYLQGTIVGKTRVTSYMEKKGYYDHLHFEVWTSIKVINPVGYLEEMEIQYV